MSNGSELAFLQLLFQNTAWANVGSVAGLQPSSSAGSFFVSLATAALSGASTQTTSEAAYTPFARVAVARSSGGWSTSGSSPTSVTNVAAVTFATATAGTPETETYSTIGRDTSGAGLVILFGPLTASLVVNVGITPSFAIGALVGTAL